MSISSNNKDRAVRAICMIGTYQNWLVEKAYNQLRIQEKEATVESLLDILQKGLFVDKPPENGSTQSQPPSASTADRRSASSEDEEGEDESTGSQDQVQGSDSFKRLLELAAMGRMTRAELGKLQAHNAAIKQKRLCHMCKSRVANVLLLPCRHIPVCNACIPTMNKLCPEPTCSLSFQAKINVFWP